MFVTCKDYNNAGDILSKKFVNECQEINSVLSGMPLYLKYSQQDKKADDLIFDPVGNNDYIKQKLIGFQWKANVNIPKEFKMWGKDIDFSKSGVLVEVQFSNYPFLLNNLVRSQLFYKAKSLFTIEPVQVAVLITKLGILPSSNSTLYYEQAIEQIDSLFSYNIFDVPLRIIGIGIERSQEYPTVFSEYQGRTSRQLINQDHGNCLMPKHKGKLKFNLS